MGLSLALPSPTTHDWFVCTRQVQSQGVFRLQSAVALALVVSTPWWLLGMARHGKYRIGWRERLGMVPSRLFDRVAPDTIWIHAVSVGEVLAVSRMVEELKTRLPGWRFVISTTTDTGQALARQRFGASDVFYFPLDFGFAVRAYLQALRPKLLVLAESEFWPNLLHQARLSGTTVAVVNARVSDRSLPRYLHFRKLLHPRDAERGRLPGAERRRREAPGTDWSACGPSPRGRKPEIRSQASGESRRFSIRSRRR